MYSATAGLWPVRRSLVISVVTGASEWRLNSASWPTHRPTITFRSVFSAFRLRACRIGLQAASKAPGLIFSSSGMPIDALSTDPTLHSTVTGSSPARRRIFTNSLVSSTRPKQVAMPIRLAPIRWAKATISSQREICP